ncbi:MAG TPA: glycosyltransferase family A protein, partial [Patescibacteria group bacterium]|nr:glycosyltransferase family A protein [Patescibacteria group bacterium]
MRSVVSVVLRNYNYAHFLEEALESVYIQTYPYIELIIADDASTDCSMAVIDNWLTSRRDRFLRVEVLTTTRNMGQTLNMNRGVRAASGKYVFQLDADNTIQREGIERLVEYSASHPDIEFLFAKLQNHKDSTWYPGCKDAEIYAGKYTEFYYLPVHE